MADDGGTGEQAIAIPTVFVGADDVTIEFANQFVIQHQEEEFILTLGQMAPPLLLGSDEEKLEQAKNLSFVPIKVIGRFGFTRDRLEALIEVLQTNLARFDKTRETKT